MGAPASSLSLPGTQVTERTPGRRDTRESTVGSVGGTDGSVRGLEGHSLLLFPPNWPTPVTWLHPLLGVQPQHMPRCCHSQTRGNDGPGMGGNDSAVPIGCRYEDSLMCLPCSPPPQPPSGPGTICTCQVGTLDRETWPICTASPKSPRARGGLRTSVLLERQPLSPGPPSWPDTSGLARGKPGRQLPLKLLCLNEERHSVQLERWVVSSSEGPRREQAERDRLWVSTRRQHPALPIPAFLADGGG